MILPLNGVDIELDNVTEEQYTRIKKFFEKLLGTRQKKRDAVADAFSYAIQECPNANHSDLWHHIIYRTYLDYPMDVDPGQSWKRVGGEGLEVFLALLKPSPGGRIISG